MKLVRSTAATALVCFATLGAAAPALAGSHFSAKKCGKQEQKLVKRYSKKLSKKNLTPAQMQKLQKGEQKALNALIKNHGCVFRG